MVYAIWSANYYAIIMPKTQEQLIFDYEKAKKMKIVTRENKMAVKVDEGDL